MLPSYGYNIKTELWEIGREYIKWTDLSQDRARYKLDGCELDYKGRSQCRDNIKMDYIITGWASINYILLIQYKDQWWDFMITFHKTHEVSIFTYL